MALTLYTYQMIEGLSIFSVNCLEHSCQRDHLVGDSGDLSFRLVGFHSLSFFLGWPKDILEVFGCLRAVTGEGTVSFLISHASNLAEFL